jgi:hypothetical protein
MPTSLLPPRMKAAAAPMHKINAIINIPKILPLIFAFISGSYLSD